MTIFGGRAQPRRLGIPQINRARAGADYFHKGGVPMSESAIPPNEQSLSTPNGELDSVKALFRSGDEAGAFPLFEKLAERGSAPAMTWVGYLYLEGKGAAVDTDAALRWFAKAVEAGDAEAMCWIGYMHYSGSGVAKDMAAARQWYLKAAEAGDSDAMSRLGQMYSFGNGVGIDMAAARHWYSKAAQSGHAEGQHRLASVLDQAGEREEAERWVRKAADQGYEPSVDWVRDRTTHQMLKEKRYEHALPVLEKAANAGSAWAHEWLGSMHWSGHGVVKDLDRSLQHYEAAYDGGRHSVATIIGRLHFVAGRPDAALEWLRRNSLRPSSSLYWQYRVVDAHPHLQRRPGESDELLRKAAEAGHVFAKRDMALRMIKGRKSLGTRLQGLRGLLGGFPHALRVIKNDENDERLR